MLMGKTAAKNKKNEEDFAQFKGSTPTFLHISVNCWRNTGSLLMFLLYLIANCSSFSLNKASSFSTWNHNMKKMEDQHCCPPGSEL